jgi:hypothetical protein
MAAIYQGTRPVDDAITKLRQNIEALANALQSGEFKLLPEDEQRRIREAAELFGRMNEAQSRYRAAGGESEYFGRRQAQFSVETSTMTALERSIAEINEQYRIQVEQARASKESAEQLAAAEASLKQMRDDQLEALRRSTAMGIARNIMPEMFARSEIEEQLRAFRAADPAALGLSAEQAGAVIQRLEERLRNLKTPMEQLVEQYQLQQAEIAATTFEQKAIIESQKAYTDAINAGKSELEAAVSAVMAYNNAVAQSQKAAYEAVRDSQRNAQMVGMTPYQRGQQAIRDQYEDQRREYGDQPGFAVAEGLDLWANKQEAIRGPLEEANRGLNEQINLARVQAQTFGKTTAAIEAAAEAQRLLNEYQRAGVPITAELNAAIQAHAERYGEAQQAIERIREAQKNWTDLKGGAQDSLKGLFSDIREGKDLVESLANAFDKLADKIFDMMLDSMFNPNSQGGFNIFQLLFGGGNNQIRLPGNTSTTAALGGAISAAPGVNLQDYAPRGIPLSSGINQAIVGSAVPAFQSQVPEISRSITQNLGKMYTTASDGIRHQVEQYVRQGAAARGMDPDTIAAGIWQESRFNPAAQNVNAKEASYGVFQLNTKGGLGAVAQQRGISLDPSNWREQADFSLDVMKEKGFGQWYGFRDVGIRDPFAAHKAFRGASLTGGAGQNSLTGDMGTDQLSQNFDQLSQSTSQLAPNMDQFGMNMSNVTQQLTTTTPQLQSSLTGLTSTVSQDGAGIGNALQSTSNTVLQSGQGLGNAFQQVANSLSSGGGGGGIGGFFSSLFGGGGGGNPFTNGGSLDWSSGMSGVSFLSHGGGPVGHTGTRSISLMDQIAFMSAPRLHKGTLRPDERYVIAQTGEEIIARDDVKAARQRGMQMSQQPVVQPAVNVNVQNNGPGEARVERRSNGDIDVIIDEVDGRLAERARRGRGPLVKAVGARQSGQGLIG